MQDTLVMFERGEKNFRTHATGCKRYEKSYTVINVLTMHVWCCILYDDTSAIRIPASYRVRTTVRICRRAIKPEHVRHCDATTGTRLFSLNIWLGWEQQRQQRDEKQKKNYHTFFEDKKKAIYKC